MRIQTDYNYSREAIINHLIKLIVILGLSFFLPLNALAFSVSPLKYTMTVDPGGAQVINITVKNTEAEVRQFKFSVVSLEQDTAGRAIIGGSDIAASWVKPEVSFSKIEAGEDKKIAFTISVPAGAYPGEHAIALAVDSLPLNQSQVGVTGRLAVPVLLSVSGVVTESVGITEFAAMPQLAISENWQLKIQLKNNGTVSVPLSGKVILKNWFGQTVTTQDLTLGNSLLPQALRQVTPKLIAGNAWLWPGLYSVNASVIYGAANLRATAVAKFWYVPAWSIVFLVVLIVGFIILKKQLKK